MIVWLGLNDVIIRLVLGLRISISVHCHQPHLLFMASTTQNAACTNYTYGNNDTCYDSEYLSTINITVASVCIVGIP